MIRLTDTSFISALLFFSIGLALIAVFRRRTRFLLSQGSAILLLAIALALARLFLPFYLPFSFIVSIPKVWPAVSLFFREHPYIRPLLTAVWAVGTVKSLSRDFRAIRDTYRQYRAYPTVENLQALRAAERLGIRCPVVTSPSVESPCVLGIFRHTIYLPAREISDRDLELTLSHELRHIRARHNQLKFLYGLLLAALWWNPVTHVFRSELNDLLELRCDEMVNSRLDPLGRYEYAQMLVDLKKQQMSDEQNALSANEAFILGTPNIVEQRIQVLTYRLDKPAPRIHPALVCGLVALFFASYLVIFEPGITPPAKDISDPAGYYFYDNYSDLYDPNPEEDSSFIFKRADGRYELYIDYAFSKYLFPDEISAEKYENIPIYEEGTNP